ncbi:MAG: hypothetical protein FI728_06445 [SAR202 cluster bacterium]|nr:hypothetical protein [SAR202 cluster bacterium]|tara:strand:+ start:367 stop:960 length:594 start_codon:yes stop_codon:yes gene_type:complete
MSDKIPEYYKIESPLTDLINSKKNILSDKKTEFVISDHPELGQVNVRGDIKDGLFIDNMREVLGHELPTDPNTVTVGERFIILCLGENEWLIITPENEERELIATLRNKMDGILTSFTDVSSSQCIIRVTGSHVRNVFAKGCSLDLHSRSFDVSKCAQSLIASVGVIIRQIDSTPSFELIVRRSFAEYLVNWLYDAV